MSADNAKFDHSSGRFITCRDAKIYVEEKGTPGLPVLVLLHGGFGNMEDFNPIVPALGAKFRLIGVDSRGHGMSGLGSEKVSYELLSEDLAQLVISLKLREFNILGFSDGGIVAYRYAAGENAHGLRKLITIGSRFEISKKDPAWEMISGMTGDMWREIFPDSYEAYLRLNPEPDFDRFAQAVVGMWRDMGPSGHPGRLMSKINSEMLVIRGDEDPLTSLEGLAKLRFIAHKVSFLNVPFAGHAVHLEDPAMVLAVVDKFVARKTIE